MRVKENCILNQPPEGGFSRILWVGSSAVEQWTENTIRPFFITT